MKKYLIRLNRPVVIDDCYHGAPIKQPVYGFFCPYGEYDSAENDYHKDCIDYYVAYLAAMHCWSENGGEEFSVINKEWVNQEGDEYPYEWRERICQRDRETLGLDYTLYVVDLDEIDNSFLQCGTDRTLIISPILMDKLIELAGGQEDEPLELRNVILFNHPIWLPKDILWGEDGFCHIYGLAIEESIDQEQVKGCLQYLGYLALIEELALNGVSPSGYTSDLHGDGYLWYNRGEEFPVGSDSITNECRLCRKKHNYKICGAVENVLLEDLRDGIKGELIISKALYEGLLDICLR